MSAKLLLSSLVLFVSTAQMIPAVPEKRENAEVRSNDRFLSY